MRDVIEVLRWKELELEKVKRQVEALRIALPLLEGEEHALSMAKAAASAREIGSQA